MSATEELSAITTEQIGQLCERIVREFHPQKIILFGSHAYGQPSADSDVDLLVIMPFEGSSRKQAARIRSRIYTSVALDLLVRTPAQISERLAMGDFFMREITEQGKVLYETDHPLTDFAVDYRYPGNAATRAEAQDAVRRCRRVRCFIRQAFGLPV